MWHPRSLSLCFRFTVSHIESVCDIPITMTTYTNSMLWTENEIMIIMNTREMAKRTYKTHRGPIIWSRCHYSISIQIYLLCFAFVLFVLFMFRIARSIHTQTRARIVRRYATSQNVIGSCQIDDSSKEMYSTSIRFPLPLLFFLSLLFDCYFLHLARLTLHLRSAISHPCSILVNKIKTLPWKHLRRGRDKERKRNNVQITSSIYSILIPLSIVTTLSNDLYAHTHTPEIYARCFE